MTAANGPNDFEGRRLCKPKKSPSLLLEIKKVVLSNGATNGAVTMCNVLYSIIQTIFSLYKTPFIGPKLIPV